MKHSAYLALIFMLSGTMLAAEGSLFREKKVLVIGIDGCRPDALLKAGAPHLQGLMRAGAFSERCDVEGNRDTGAATSSGPGWSSALNGVLADKHGVLNNQFTDANLIEYPTFFHRLKEVRPDACTAAFVTWKPLYDEIFQKDESCRLVFEGKGLTYREGDRLVAMEVTQFLQESAPLDAAFVYFGAADGVGHSAGFGPESLPYIEAIEQIDLYVGQVLEALKRRKHYAQEDWLIIVCTDHGGRNKGHGARGVPEIRNGILIISGPSAQRGTLSDPVYLVDVAAIALVHLGVELKPEWHLDGRPIGLAREAVEPMPSDPR